MESAWLLDFRSYFAAELKQLRRDSFAGQVSVDESGIQVTPTGWFFVRAVAMVFDRYLRTALAATALLMGLAAGPHCMGMCGAACAGVSAAGGRAAGCSQWAFQAGRLAGYALAGAVAAQTVGSLAWLSAHTAALRPV